MAVLDILTYPNPFLSQVTVPVSEIDETIQQLIDDMIETMYVAPGVGLAAPQVGYIHRLIVYEDNPAGETRRPTALINPRIISSTGSVHSESEGCLSVPDYRADVKRAESVVVDALDRHGHALHIEAEGIQSIVLQHEIDHLEGILFIDRISSLKRQIYKRRIKKQMKSK